MRIPTVLMGIAYVCLDIQKILSLVRVSHKVNLPQHNTIILLHEKFLQFDWLRAVVSTDEKYKPFVGSNINNNCMICT